MITVPVDEIFASIQGEGPYVGQRHIFLRFIGCDLQCAYCDTPDGVKTPEGSLRPCRAQISPDSFDREELVNPLTGVRLTEVCERLRVAGSVKPWLSLTGGEPLLHAEFLEQWLPAMRGTYRIYLETNGIRHVDMQQLASLVDLVSMDIKLPSSTGQRERWDEHGLFLDAALGSDVFVKAVVTGDCDPEDLWRAVRLVAERRKTIPFIIQPVSGMEGPNPEMLVRLQNKALAVLDDVRVVPQVHKMLLVP
ncbi:MAG: 7-carboxy-7-deazaguanine synthase QueE [Nitrospirota bacterium]|nr:7-carboxy-7-deazaguanine synthase QueE [Nitrospirota bacterium]